ncbi:MAG: tetratricopeptide repeat protein [Verrucomicrobiae bacterium]|nr:tetratricopeptide repeat protein [Verrucomicrobiae bacterium]
MSRPRLIALLLALVTCAAFLPLARYGFTSFDDPDYVVKNEVVQKGLTWSGLGWAFTTGKTGNWFPLTWISHMAVCQVFGLNAGAHHLANVCFHVANTVLLLALLLRLTNALWPSAFAAALFAWHPLHVESVAWISERKDMVSTFFGLAALVAYTYYVQSKKPLPAVAGSAAGEGKGSARYYTLTLILFAFSLMSKPMLVTLPCVLLLLDYWPFRRILDPGLNFADLKRLLLEKWPFFVLSVALSPITYAAQKAGGYVTSLDAIPWADRLGNIPLAYCRYLWQMIWPVDLVVFYPFPMGISGLLIAAATLLLVLISATVWLERRRAPYALMGWLWFLGTLVPVIGLVTFGGQAMANRFTYFPAIGLFLAVALGLRDVAVRWRFSPGVVAGPAGVILLACLVLTENQLRYWRDDVTLFSHVMDVTKDNRWVHFRDLGILHNRLGYSYESQGKHAEAIAEYRAAIALRPYYYVAHYNLGVALNEAGNLDEAYQHFQTVLQLQPDDVHAMYAMGIILISKGQFDDATALFQKILKLKPDFAGAYYQTGVVLGRKGQVDEAMLQYQEALKLNPDLVEAHNSLGVALARKGNLAEAISHFEAALKADPNNAGALYNLGLAYNGQGQLDMAISLFQKVIALQPENADAHNNLGLALSRQGQLDAAISQFQIALGLNPNHARARKNLDAALKFKGGQPSPSLGTPGP